MTTAQTIPLIGPGIHQVDGPLKVTGAAHYPSDFSFPNLTYAVLVQSTIAAGSIRHIDTTATHEPVSHYQKNADDWLSEW